MIKNDNFTVAVVKAGTGGLVWKRHTFIWPTLRAAARTAADTVGACNLLRFSASFPDATALMAECSRRGLEGIVAKRKDVPYRSGTRSGWVKVKTSEWRADDLWRAEFFEKR